jgi:VWFA-related protein
MKLFLLSSALLLAAWAPLAAAPPNAQPKAPAKLPPPPSFGEVMEVHVVNVDVYVTDRDGRRVTGLKQGDFAVSEDGKAVQLSNFAAVERKSATAAAPRSPSSPRTPVVGGKAASAEEKAPAADPENALSLVVFVDNLHIRPQNRTRAVEQIRKFMGLNVRPGDRVLLATHDTGLTVRRSFTDDAASVDATLREIERLPTYGQQEDASRQVAYRTMLEINSMSPCGLEMIKPVEGYADQVRADALRTVKALTVMINSLSGVPGRKALLFVSDGISITPGEELFEAARQVCSGAPAAGISTADDSRTAGSGAPRGAGEGGDGTGRYQDSQAALDAQKYSVAKQFESLAAHASANRVTFYTLQASGLQTSTVPADVEGSRQERLIETGMIQQIQTSNLKGSLTALAVDTGGRAMLDANDFLPELARMQEDFDTYYSLGYTPAHLGDGRDHRVEVKVKRPGLRVRYLQSYRDKPAMEKVADRTLAALLHGIEDNPLDVEIEIGDSAPADAGQYAVPVRLKIPLFKLAILSQRDGGYYGKLRVLVATRDEVGGTSAVRRVEVPLEIPRKEVLNAMGQYYVYTLTLKMKPGAQHVAVGVRDDIAAVTSYLSRPVTVGATAAVSK